MAFVEVNIWGETLGLNYNSNIDKIFLQNVAEYLNETMNNVKKGRTIDTKTLALRASFLIASEYLALKDAISKMEQVINESEIKLNNVIIE